MASESVCGHYGVTKFWKLYHSFLDEAIRLSIADILLCRCGLVREVIQNYYHSFNHHTYTTLEYVCIVIGCVRQKEEKSFKWKFGMYQYFI